MNSKQINIWPDSFDSILAWPGLDLKNLDHQGFFLFFWPKVYDWVPPSTTKKSWHNYPFLEKMLTKTFSEIVSE